MPICLTNSVREPTVRTAEIWRLSSDRMWLGNSWGIFRVTWEGMNENGSLANTPEKSPVELRFAVGSFWWSLKSAAYREPTRIPLLFRESFPRYVLGINPGSEGIQRLQKRKVIVICVVLLLAWASVQEKGICSWCSKRTDIYLDLWKDRITCHLSILISQALASVIL